MLGDARSRRDNLTREKETANARYRAARFKAKLRGLEAKNAKKALRAADFYVSRVLWVIGESRHKEVLSHIKYGHPSHAGDPISVHSAFALPVQDLSITNIKSDSSR
jgi:hypothetical protein